MMSAGLCSFLELEILFQVHMVVSKFTSFQSWNQGPQHLEALPWGLLIYIITIWGFKARKKVMEIVHASKTE